MSAPEAARFTSSGECYSLFGSVTPSRTLSTLPNWPRRMAAGAWHVLAGIGFLVRHPRMWPLAALPAILAVLFWFLGLALGLFVAPRVDPYLVPRTLPGILRFPLTWLLWIGLAAAGMVVGLALALVISAPILERISRKVEQVVRGRVIERSRGTRWEILQSVRGALFFLAAALVALPVPLIPVIGPFLAALWASQALALQQTEAPLTRRGLDFFDRRQWHRQLRPESLGLGLAGIVLFLVPFASFLLAPALSIAGTLFVLEMEDETASGRAPVAEVASR